MDLLEYSKMLAKYLAIAIVTANSAMKEVQEAHHYHGEELCSH